MTLRWIHNFGVFSTIIITEIICTPYVGYNTPYVERYNTNFFTRQTRQIIGHDNNSPFKSLLCDSKITRYEKSCTIDIKKLGYDHALIIDPSDRTKFVYPDSKGKIIIKKDQTIYLSCPGQNNHLKNLKGSPFSSKVTCLCGTIFKANDEIHDFNEFSCKLPPKYEILDKGFYGRESEYRKFEIGFYTSEKNDFLKLIDVHYDRSTTSTMYVKSLVSKYINGKQKPVKHRYDQTHCCERQRNRLDMDLIYNSKMQDRSFAAQLYCHDSEFYTKCSYLNESSAIIFSLAQLAPRSSFIYTSASLTTFVYLNTGPQWRPINEGNWARIEDHVIEITKELGKDLIVYTGIYGRLKLKDTGDENKEKIMFLYANANNERSIAIPLYFWKIIYEPDGKRGVVFVTVNNLYLNNIEDYHICEKPMFNKDGVQMPRQWKPKNINKGYSYMCEVPDFLRNTELPFHDFTPAMVNELLYLTKRTDNESSLREKKKV